MTDFTSLPHHLYTAAQVQQLDRIAIESFDIPGFKLMQRAGAVAYATSSEQWPQVRELLIFAGGGNNGGDGYIIAGLAAAEGISVTVIQLADGESLRGDAKTALDWAQQHAIKFQDFSESPGDIASHGQTVLVDAMLGTGLDREVQGRYAAAIDWINQSGLPVLAVDIPSGLHATTGAMMGCAVQADVTVSFIGIKQGMLTHRGRDFIGKLHFSDLEIPTAVYRTADAPPPSAERFDINVAAPNLLPRQRSSHKGSHGHVVVVGGDHGFGGAVLMAAEAAQRSGAGLVSLITRSGHRVAMLARRPEVMVAGTEDDDSRTAELLGRASVICIGPGLGRGQWSQALLQQVLAQNIANKTPLVVDADALTLLADWGEMNQLRKRDTWILTPHPGEAATLLDCSVEDIQQDRFAAVKKLQHKWGGACLLKGSGSLTCHLKNAEQIIGLCTEGNAGMASGGMGDVLSGVIAGLLAQGLALEDSLRCAVAVHGEAGDLASEAQGQRGLLATDLLPYIQRLVNPSL